MEQRGSCYRTFRYRLHPTKLQTQTLLLQQRYQCELYNAALEERIGAWNWERRSVRFFDQCRTLTGLKAHRPEVVACGITLCRGTLKRLDHAFAAFFRRVKLGETARFPRYKSVSRFDSLEWGDHGGWKLNIQHRRLYLKGIGEIKANYHRPFIGEPKMITVKREGVKWWLCVRCVNAPAMPLARTFSEIGIDLGVVNEIATSDGELKKGQRFGLNAQKKLAQAQRALATKERGSNRRRRQVEEVARIHRKIKNQRANAAHQLSRQLVNDHDFIALEDLKITNMVRAPKGQPIRRGRARICPMALTRRPVSIDQFMTRRGDSWSRYFPTRLRVPVGQ